MEDQFKNTCIKCRSFFDSLGIVKKIRQRSRADWVKQYRDWIVQGYNLVTDDGGHALIAGFLGGAFLVLFWKFSLKILGLVIIVAAIIWLVAPASVAAESSVGSEV